MSVRGKWTTRGIEALEVAERTDFTDPTVKGLVLRITPSGAKTWSLLYRRRSDNRKRRFTLGDFPGMGLADARAAAEGLRVQIRSGADPAGAATEYKRAETVNQLLDLFLEQHAKPKAAWTRELKRIFAKDVRPVIGSLKARDVTRPHVRTVLDRVRARGATTTVNRTLAAVRRAFSWAISKDLVMGNPAAHLVTEIEELSRDRALDESEIGTFWHGLERAPMSERTRIALRLVLVTGQRPGEVCGARRSEVDLGDGKWLIPSTRAKNRQAHMVPLSPLALRLFREAAALAGDSEFLFPSRARSSKGGITLKPLESHALSHAMRGALEAMRLSDRPARPHDLRRTTATQMAKLGISDLVVARVLNHGTELRRTITARVYLRHDYAEEKRHALASWAARLEVLIAGANPVRKVVQFTPVNKTQA